jgi:hypothetical protein
MGASLANHLLGPAGSKQPLENADQVSYASAITKMAAAEQIALPHYRLGGKQAGQTKPL